MPSKKVVLSQKPKTGAASIVPLTLSVGDSITFNHRTYVIQQINVPDSTGQSVVYFSIPDASATAAATAKIVSPTNKRPVKKPVL